jgi:poly-gamma-glutamate synthesis protein (capsule biosynthesis protein)
MATVLIAGDVCPIGVNTPLFRCREVELLFGDLLPEFRAADLVVANLECPLIVQSTPIAKTGPVFGEDPSCLNAIKAAGIGVLCLANNHILDHGTEGLRTTLASCAAAGIATVGAGVDLAAARRMFVTDVKGLRMGIVAMAEHEFSIATERRAGANPLDVMHYVRTVTADRQSIDFLIVLLHGGDEFLTAPSPRLKDTCHFFVEMGADLVVVQHPHAFGGYESYRHGHIVYGQGALLMDEAIYRNKTSFHEGVLIKVQIARGDRSCLELVPFVQSDTRPGARKMPPARAEAFLRDLAAKAAAILDDEYVRSEWLRFCEERKHEYMSVLLSHSRVLRRANRQGRMSSLLYNRRRLLGTRNVVCCETHREAIETILNEPLV